MRGTDQSRASARRGFFPVVSGGNVYIEEAGGAIFLAKESMSLSRGGGQWLVAGRDQTVERGGGAILLSRRARVTNGFVGLLLAERVTMDGTARALLTVPVSVAAAATAAFVLGLFLGRHRRPA